MKITDAAKTALEPILAQNPGKLLRVVFEGFGWGGPRLGLALDEPGENDNKMTLNGIELLAEKSLNSFLDGQVIDFVNSGMREGFVISPEFGSSCS